MILPPPVFDTIDRLRNAGHQAVLAGGCVRDMLLSKSPKDYDIATSAPPGEVAALFPGSQLVGAHFGVVIVPAPGGGIEVASFRTDGPYQDGRRPESIRLATAEEDAHRRDFTINGLFFDPITEQVIDYVGGQTDLAAKRLRAIGDPADRFAEDHLRLLRAIRFATVLDFEIDPSTWKAIQSQADSIRSVSAERVRDELNRIWLNSNRVRGFDLLVASGLMAQILPEILALQGCEQPPQFHPEGDVFVHTRLMLSLLQPDAPLPVVLSVLFHDIAKPATQTVDEDTGRIRFNGHDQLGAQVTADILRRLKYPNPIIQAVTEAVDCHMQFKDVRKMRLSRLKRFMARDGFEDELELHRVDCLGSSGFLDNHQFLLEKQREFASSPLIPPRLLDGRDLLQMGVLPGPRLGQLLNDIQNLQLEGQLTTREEAITWLASKEEIKTES